MPSVVDTRIGQLAIARGLVSLSDLMVCVEQSVTRGSTLAEVLVERGKLTEDDLRSLEARLASASAEEVERELELGNTVIVAEFTRSQAEWMTLPADADGDDPTTAEFDLGIELEIDLELSNDARYDVHHELGRGGMGRVVLATDKILQRKVAIKTLVDEARTDKGRTRLLAEAQVTGLLEHPSIVPVYDLRAARDGEPFYTMRVVQERNLDQILREMRRGEGAYSLTHLLTILRQVSLAVQFAHELGVIHRDIKPENILVGKYGEVYVIDWGVAKIVNSDIGLSTTGKVVMGQLVGTPQYMAPEQARGDNDSVDERSDVYALGAVLYEVLTLGPVFDADHVLALLFQAVHEMPVSPRERAPDREIPAELEEVCLKALEKDPDRRYQSAQEFADELELFLEGVKERERRAEMAQQALEQAAQIRAVYEEVGSELARTLRELNRERRRVETWATPDEKRELWDLQQRAEDLQVEIERKFGETVRIYGQALVHMPQMPEARRALADLYWQRFQEAEAAGSRANAAYFEGLVRQYNDGAYDQLLEGTAHLSVETEPSGADVVLYRYHEVRRRLVEWRVAELPPTPIVGVDVSHGSLVLEVTKPGYTPVLVPVLARRAEACDVKVRLWREGVIPDDFVVVPAGTYISGNMQTEESETKFVDDFAIMRFPVTVGQYLEFLNELMLEDAEAACRHAPRVKDGGPYLPRDEQGRFYLPTEDADGDAWSPDWPILMINYYDAEAFAAWRSERDNRRYRLPTMDEWEKAARGVDGRTYPWGNHFDASFCLMRESRRGKSLPAPVGSFPIDRSPYGMMEVAGNVNEWTSTVEPGSDDIAFLGGAAYNSIALMCRLDWNLTSPKHFPFTHYGFRLVLPLSDA